jgi:hypothetical protein
MHKIKKETHEHTIYNLRDRPFNLKGGYGFLFRSEFFFRTTQELEKKMFCRAKREIFSSIQH